MRSASEVTFRLKQELQNAWLLAFPPTYRAAGISAEGLLPEPQPIAERLRSTEFATRIGCIADEILAHRFPVLGFTVETGSQIDWRRDYVHQRSTGKQYFRFIPYLDARRAGDHKNIWELNRHQHLVVLAQGFLLFGRDAYLEEIFEELESWWLQNPYQRGINWTSALEVAFRAFSWLWIDHLAGSQMAPAFRARFLESLYQHGRHVENNLSFYFSPNTHLLGEAVVLHALGRLFPSFPHAQRWMQLGGETVVAQLGRQVQADGSHFEQSTYYHVYALDMFLFHAVISEVSRDYLDCLGRMADFLNAVLGSERLLPFLGDDDGGRWFHPYGERSQFGRATLATCAKFLKRTDWTFDTEDLYLQAAWWLGELEGCARAPIGSRIFEAGGLSVLQAETGRVIIDCGRFGPGRAGHSHSDSLSLVAATKTESILVDSGTYTYVGDAHLRDAFRGSAAHSTIRLDGRDQAVPFGPFWWGEPPLVQVVSSKLTKEEDEVVGECRYAGIMHRRLVRFAKPDLIFVLDWVDGPPGEHMIEQFWHLGSREAQWRVQLASEAQEFECWHSPVFGRKERARCLVVRHKSGLPCGLSAVLLMNHYVRVTATKRPDDVRFETSDDRSFEIRWPKNG